MITTFKGKVISGFGLGKNKLFPTMNFETNLLSIPYGVYLCNCLYKGNVIWGVMHFGPKKTINNDMSLEIHLFNFSENIYGEMVEVSVYKKLRNIQKCNTLNELKKLIESDIKQAKELITSFSKES